MSDDLSKEYTPEQKLWWEIEKLKAETNNLRRSWSHSPATWISIITTTIALGGVAIQYVNSNNAYQLAEIKRQQAELETTKTENTRNQLLNEIVQLETTLTQRKTERDKISSEIVSLQSRAKDLQDKVIHLASTPNEIKDAIQQVSKFTEDLLAINQQATIQTEETASNLRDFSQALKERESSSPTLAIVASFKTLDQALKHAQELKKRNLAYPLEVYQRDPNRYAVTLGGYLSYQEALNRVEYAKQQGIAKDAYVRFAKDWGENLFK